MEELKGLIEQWGAVHAKLETTLRSISTKMRNAVMGEYISTFYGKHTSAITTEIFEKTKVELKSVQDIILRGDKNLFEYNIKIEEMLLSYFEEKIASANPGVLANNVDNYCTNCYSLIKKYRDEFKGKNDNIPLAYLTKYINSSKTKNEIEESSKDEEPLYSTDDTTRNKLRKVNKRIADLLVKKGLNGSLISNIYRKRYVFYGTTKDHQNMLALRTQGMAKSTELFDVMDETELLHHLNISVELLSYLKNPKSKDARAEAIEQKMLFLAVQEAREVLKNEGIEPIQYKNKYIELKKDKTKKIEPKKETPKTEETAQVSFFD